MMKKVLSAVLSAVLLLSMLTVGASAQKNWDILGDVNGDLTVSINDAVQVYYHVNGKASVDETVADLNGDGAVNIADAVALYYFVNGKDVDAGVDGLLYDTVQLDTLPRGEKLSFTVAADVGDMGHTNDAGGVQVYVVRSLEELTALHERGVDVLGYTEGYTAEYFEDGALVVVDLIVCDLPNDVAVEEVVKEDGELAVTVCRYYGIGREEPIYRHGFVLEMAAEDLADVTSTAAYDYEAVNYPVNKADEKPTGEDVAFTLAASVQNMADMNSKTTAVIIRSLKDLAAARDLLTEEQYASYTEDDFNGKTLLLLNVNYPDCAGTLYVNEVSVDGMTLNVCYVYETDGESLPAFSDRTMLLELDVTDVWDVALYGETVLVP